MEYDDLLRLHRVELRRGSAVLASLISLQTPGYGYGLLEELNSVGFDIEANTLYPLLRRLEEQGLLTSDWDTTQSRPRKFYVVSDIGLRLAGDLRAELADLISAYDRLSEGKNNADTD